MFIVKLIISKICLKFLLFVSFQTEFENDAETLVSQLEEFPNPGLIPGELTKEDDELDSALKMAHLDMYKTKLRERERRKRVSRDHQLISKQNLIYSQTRL